MSIMKDNKVSFKVYGRYALFSDPIVRLGGEKLSYQIPTYQALKGIVESVYWKPTITWHIDRCRVMKIIQTEAKGIRPIVYFENKNTLSLYTYLKEVEYQVEAHFEWNEHRPDLVADRNENKHWIIAKRMIERGGRRDIFLGTRECQAYVEPCVFGEGESIYDTVGELSFGLMFHGFSYPDETGIEMLSSRFFRPAMCNGIIEYPQPSECTIIKEVHPMQMKEFILDENVSVQEEEFN